MVRQRTRWLERPRRPLSLARGLSRARTPLTSRPPPAGASADATGFGEELAFALATVCDAGDIDLKVAKDVIDTIAKVQHSARMYCSEVAGDA